MIPNSIKFSILKKFKKTNYVLFIIIIFIFSLYFLYNALCNITSSDIENFIYKLENSCDYDLPELNPEYYLGKNSKIAVLNESNTVIYTNYTSWYKDYLDNELLEFIDFRKHSELDNANFNKCENKIFKASFINNNGENRTLIFSIKLCEKINNSIFKNILKVIIPYFLFYIILLSVFNRIHCNELKKIIECFEKIIECPDERNYKELNNKYPNEISSLFKKLIHLFNEYEHNEWKNTRIYINKNILISELAHDSKNNLTVILGYLSSLDDNIFSKNDINKYTNIIKDKVNDTSELISKFYEYNNMEHPDFPIKLESINLCEFLKQYLARKHDELLINGFFLEVSIPDKCIYCKLDLALFSRAIDNIVGNSLKYNIPGTTLIFNLEENDSSIILLVGDNGIGIPDHIIDIIFNPFISGEKSSGLGMTITQKIILAHNAKIILKNTPNLGCTTQFEIIFNKL